MKKHHHGSAIYYLLGAGLLVGVLTGCISAAPPSREAPTATAVDTVVPATPLILPTLPPTATPAPPYTVDQLSIQFQGGNPPTQANVMFDLVWPDNCTVADVVGRVDATAHQLWVEIAGRRNPAVECAAIQTNEQKWVLFDLSSLPAGEYTVQVGAQTRQLSVGQLIAATATPTATLPATAPTTPLPTATPAPPSGAEIGLAQIMGMDLIVTAVLPLQATVTVRGNLPDSCTRLGVVRQSRDLTARVLRVEVPLVRAESSACATVASPFSLDIPLDLSKLPAGVYQVDVNGIAGSVELGADNP